jgi:hypothetical protein
VEFSLLIGFAVFLLTGFFDLGRAIFYYSSLSNAVREGARSGTVDKCPTVDHIFRCQEINDYNFLPMWRNADEYLLLSRPLYLCGSRDDDQGYTD